MGRRRKDIIVESAADLRRLAAQYAGKPQQGRLLFLASLKENPYCSIAEGAETVEIGERQGRYLWEDYRAGGLPRVLARRGWKRKESEPVSAQAHVSSADTVGGMSATDLLGFMKGVAELGTILEPVQWGTKLKSLLIECIPEVDYAVVSVVHDPVKSKKNTNLMLYHNILPDGNVKEVVVPIGKQKTPSTILVDNGIAGGFPFDRYHFPPFFLDLYSQSEQSEQYVGSLLFFRHTEHAPFSSQFGELLESLREFLAFVFISLITRLSTLKPGANRFRDAIAIVARDIHLTNREQDILLLQLLGHTHEEIADLLNIAPATVSKHVRGVYKKAGVRRLSEFFARYFTPLDYSMSHGERGEEKVL